MEITAHPKWTARLVLDDEELAAESCRWDTLKETSHAAVAEAAEYLRAGLASTARVNLYKQLTRDPQPAFDRQTAYLWVEDGVVLVQR